MILETNRTMALKNVEGTYDIKKISLFGNGLQDISVSITSQESESGSTVVLKIICPLCGSVHSYKYNVQDFVCRPIIAGGCDFTGMPLFYMGDPEKVINKIDKIKKINKKIYAHIV